MGTKGWLHSSTSQSILLPLYFLEVMSVNVQPIFGISNLRSTHHATSGKHCVVHRICLYVAAPTDEINLDHNEVVDMLKVIPDALPGGR